MVPGFLIVSDDISGQLSKADGVNLFMQAAFQLGHPSHIPAEGSCHSAEVALGRLPVIQARQGHQTPQLLWEQAASADALGACSSWVHLSSPSISHVKHSPQSLVYSGC